MLTDLGRNGEPTNISFHANIKARVLIERPAFDFARLIRSNLGDKSIDVSKPLQEEIELEKRVEIEARGVKARGGYDRIELLSASFKEY